MHVVQQLLRQLWPWLAGIWAGMLIGHSLIATPAKFLAPTLTRPVAFDVGRYSFMVFTPFEWALAAVLAAAALFAVKSPVQRAAIAVVVAAVVIQALWLLPALNLRAALVIDGLPPAPGFHHTGYVLLEGLKTLLLAGLSGWAAIAAARATSPSDPGYSYRPDSSSG